MFKSLILVVALGLFSGNAFAQTPCLGTQSLHGDDLSLLVAVNGILQFNSTVSVNANDTLDFITGTIDFAQNPYTLVFEFTNGAPASTIPGLCVSGTFSTLLLPAGTLGYEGTYHSMSYPGGLGGLSLTVQSVVVSPQAANGVFASSDPLTLVFN